MKKLEDCSFLKEIISVVWWDTGICGLTEIKEGICYRDSCAEGYAVGKFVRVDDKELVLAPLVTEGEILVDYYQGTPIVLPRSCIKAYLSINDVVDYYSQVDKQKKPDKSD